MSPLWHLYMSLFCSIFPIQGVWELHAAHQKSLVTDVEGLLKFSIKLLLQLVAHSEETSIILQQNTAVHVMILFLEEKHFWCSTSGYYMGKGWKIPSEHALSPGWMLHSWWKWAGRQKQTGQRSGTDSPGVCLLYSPATSESWHKRSSLLSVDIKHKICAVYC